MCDTTYSVSGSQCRQTEKDRSLLEVRRCTSKQTLVFQIPEMQSYYSSAAVPLECSRIIPATPDPGASCPGIEM